MPELVQQAAATAGAVALLGALLWRLVRPHVQLFVQGVVDRIGDDLSSRVDALETTWKDHQHDASDRGRRLSGVEAELARVVSALSNELVLYRTLLQRAGILPERRQLEQEGNEL